MQTKIKKQKGFTLVELVVVIAIIAVLTAILIPSIGYVIEHTKETSDMTTVKTLNTVLVEDEARNGKPTLFSEAIKVVENKGYNIEKLTPLSTGDILWDSKNNRFLLRKGTETLYRDNNDIATTDVDLWTVATKETGLSESYSNYLKSDEEFATGLTVFTGLDVGTHSEITSVEYKVKDGRTDAQNVAIITNGVNVTLSVTGLVKSDGSGDIIRHYGKAGEIQIIECAMESFHEYGLASYVQIKKGHLAIEKGSIVDTIYLEAINNAFDNIKISYDKGIEFPKFARSAVSIPSENKRLLVCELQEIGKKGNFIWLTNKGLYNDVKISSNKDGNDDLDISNGTEKEQEFARQISCVANGGAIYDSGKDSYSETGKTLFAGGTGTKNNPYLINNDNIKNINTFINGTNNDTTLKYYKLIEDIDINGRKWVGMMPIYFQISSADIDLNGKTIHNLSFYMFSVNNYLNIYNGRIDYKGNGCLVMAMTPFDRKIVCNNLTLTGTTASKSVIIDYNHMNNATNYSSLFEIDNVISYVNIDSQHPVGGFIANAAANTDIVITNCINYGNIKSGGTSAYGFINGTAKSLSVTNSKYYGIISVVENSISDYCSPKAINDTDEIASNRNNECKGNTAAKGNIAVDNTLITVDENTKAIKINAKLPYNKYIVYVNCYMVARPEIIEKFGYRAGTTTAMVKTLTANADDVLETGFYAYAFKDGKFDTTTDTEVDGSYTRIFTRNGVNNVYFVNDDFTYMVSDKNATIKVYAYVGDALTAIGTLDYTF